MFCIPEATLGLGLAGGLSYALPRLDSGNRALGLCLGLTGMALQGADLLTAQLASQYFTYAHLAALVERITDVSVVRTYYDHMLTRHGTFAHKAINRQKVVLLTLFSCFILTLAWLNR